MKEAHSDISSPVEEEKSHICPYCGLDIFKRKDNLTKHIRKVHAPKQDHTCTVCGLKFDTKDSLRAHVEEHIVAEAKEKDKPPPKKRRKVQVLQCKFCGFQAQNEVELRQHVANHLNDDDEDLLGPNVKMEKSLEGALKVLTFYPKGIQKADLPTFMSDMRSNITKALKKQTLGRLGVKWYPVCKIKFGRNVVTDDGTEERTTTTAHIGSASEVRLPGDSDEDLQNSIDRALYNMYNHLDSFTKLQGTGWQVEEIQFLKLNMARYKSVRGASYLELPPEIRNSRAILNIQNKDEKCFLWSILAALHPVAYEDHAYRVGKYLPYENELNMEGIEFPVSYRDIPKFVKQNNISVNIVGYEGTFFPAFQTKPIKDIHVDLLHFEKEGESHYCLIRDLNRMLSFTSKNCKKRFHCSYCFHGFCEEKPLLKHIDYCSIHGHQKTELPGPNEVNMEFTQIQKMLKVPYVIYADFECILEPTQEEGKKSIHTPCGYSYLVVSTDETVQPKIVTYSDDNVLEHFFEDILEETSKLMKIVKTNHPMIMTDEDEMMYERATVCHICEKEIIPNPEKKVDKKVRDHCHLTGKYRGAAHSKCNLAYRVPYFIPVFFHNLEGYDAHLLMQELGKYTKYQIKCIPKSLEKYISFSLGHIRFLDSYNFMSASLAKLVENLAADGDQHFHHLKRHFPNVEERSLLLRKGVYPYEWMDDIEKMNHPSLPSQEKFYSALTLQGVTDEDYKHAQTVWEKFKMTKMKDYHDLYLKSDVLLLADCFENFREKCLEFYKLDPAQFFTTPGLSWAAALKMTGVQLELITDMNMHLLIEKGVRGGISTIVTRYAKANNKYMGAKFNEKEESVYLLDLDANNLYGWAMSQPLPTDTFTWVLEEDLVKLQDTILNLEEDSPTGFILEVDLEVPEDMHDYFNEYVPAPEHFKVTSNMLSNANKECLQKLKLKHTTGEKLIPNLHNKEKYVLHYRALQCYTQLGLRLTKIHSAIEFNQSAWLKVYIDFNTKQRKLAKNTFEKDFFKLMNNSVFGKTIENLRNRTDVELVNTEKRLEKVVCKPTAESFHRFNEHLVAVRKRIPVLKLNRPIYAGMTILDLSKVLMYNFYYKVMKKRYEDRLNLLFTDTDSLCVSVRTEDVYKDMLEMQDEFDCSDYPVDHPLHSTTNKKVLGKFKDEMKGAIVEEFVGLRAKMYSILWTGGSVRTCKGISTCVNKFVHKHEMYKECLLNTNCRVDKIVRIGSVDHKLYTMEQKKISLSPFDDKRYILDDKVKTLAYGHYNI